MATGAGKTVVMAMLIARHTLNTLQNLQDRRSGGAFPIMTPGITIRDRFRVLYLAYVRSPEYYTYMAKLTLSVNGSVVARAKRYAARQGTSVSWLVEQFLTLLSGAAAPKEERIPESLARLRAELEGVSFDVADYKKYLERKYR